MTIQGRTDLALEFLQRLRPNGPWILTSILPNKGQISTQTFAVEHLEEMRKWIEGYQGIRNIYYTLNSVREATTTKPTKSDISEMIALHCDCDPYAGEDLGAERIRILKKLRNFEPAGSILVDSGNGYQIIFLLEQPIPLDGTVEMAEEYERYNRQLEILLAGDACFNLDRVLRLPGTINVPDEKKVKKGRVPSLASVVEWDDGRRYSLSSFIAAPAKIQTQFRKGSEQLPGGEEKVHLSGNLISLYVDDLPARGVLITDNVKVLIIHGKNPDMPNQYKSRSEALFFVVCALVRGGADDDTIAAIIMNRENKISESVLDKPRPDKYTAKQIQSAREHVEEPILHELNSKHAVISDLGGKCRIISEVFDFALKRSRVSYQSFLDFMNRYCHRKVQVATDKEGKAVHRPAGKWWVENPKRRQYETIVFSPGCEVPEAYNLWQGFAYESIPGDCQLFLDHVLNNLCHKNEEHYKYLISWMARCVQQPDCAGEVAVVLKGDMGTGKSFFAKTFGSLFGRHFLQVSDSKHLVGSFNSHLRDCVVLFGDEAFYAGDKKHESVLKSLITEESLTIESKGVDILSSPNYVHLLMASNSSWIVPAGNNERRFFVLEVSSDKMQNKPYFSAIREQMNRGGYEALLHYLLSYDIKAFEVRDVPQTVALQDQKIHSYAQEDIWWYEKLEEGRLLGTHDFWEKEIQKIELQNDYIAFMTKVGMIRKASSTVLGKFLAKVCPGGPPRSYQRMARLRQMDQQGHEFTVNRRVYFYEIPDLAACRAQWDKFHGGPFKWGDVMKREEQGKLNIAPEAAFK